jgi:2-dehydro-3-deoxygluconokinase
VFRGATGFHLSGVTPAISQRASALAREAVRQAVARRVPVSFDMNFRSRLWQWEPETAGRELAARVVRELLLDVRLFLGGPDDVEMLTGRAVPPGAGQHEAAARLLASCWPGLQHVAMLRREAISATHQRLGAILLDTASGVCHELPQWHDMESVVDRLGGGDAFAAGLLFALGDAELREPEQALAFAAAVSCLAHTVPGDFAMVSRAEAEALASGSGGGRVGR